MTDPFWHPAAAGTVGARAGARTGRAGATSARMALGTALCRLRQDAGMTQRDASAATGVPAGLITGIELGQAEVRMWDIAGLYSAYGVSDSTQRTTLLGLAHRANRPEWWHAYRGVIPGWFEYYLGLEQAAGLIRCYAPQTIPALLQTTDYARAAIGARLTGEESQDGRRIELRMRRQDVLHGPEPARLWTVIDEAALRRPVGSRKVMREQLRHLISMCSMPHITLRVLTFKAGAHPAATGALTLLRLPDRQLPDIAYLEQFPTGTYYHDAAELDYFRHVLNQLALQAESVITPQQQLTQILAET